MREAAWFIAGQTQSQPAGALAGLVTIAKAAMKHWRSRARLARLDDMDDHLLADIGLTREDVHFMREVPWSEDPSLALQRRALCNRKRGWRA
jgi:uncharacterized protein YjiS (DUF1127 family)